MDLTVMLGVKHPYGIPNEENYVRLMAAWLWNNTHCVEINLEENTEYRNALNNDDDHHHNDDYDDDDDDDDDDW